jgi:quercetin dioxygenase-like cupin family protein
MGEIIFMGPDEGEVLGKGRLILGLDQLTLLEYTLDATHEADRTHIHKRHVDAFFVIDGELEFQIGQERSLRAPAGSLVAAPPGVVHAFPRAATQRARFLNLHAPGGFHNTLRELLEVRSTGREPTQELRQRHDGFPTPWPAR